MNNGGENLLTQALRGENNLNAWQAEIVQFFKLFISDPELGSCLPPAWFGSYKLEDCEWEISRQNIQCWEIKGEYRTLAFNWVSETPCTRHLTRKLREKFLSALIQELRTDKKRFDGRLMTLLAAGEE